jgi:hypothetical protein
VPTGRRGHLAVLLIPVWAMVLGSLVVRWSG